MEEPDQVRPVRNVGELERARGIRRVALDPGRTGRGGYLHVRVAERPHLEAVEYDPTDDRLAGRYRLSLASNRDSEKKRWKQECRPHHRSPRGMPPWVQPYAAAALMARLLHATTRGSRVIAGRSHHHTPVSYTHLRAHETPEHL